MNALFFFFNSSGSKASNIFKGSNTACCFLGLNSVSQISSTDKTAGPVSENNNSFLL